MSGVAVRGSQRFESPPVRSDLKSHDLNRKAKNRSNLTELRLTMNHSFFEIGFQSRDSRHLRARVQMLQHGLS